MATVLKLERNCPDLDLNLLDQSKNAGNISIFHLEGWGSSQHVLERHTKVFNLANMYLQV